MNEEPVQPENTDEMTFHPEAAIKKTKVTMCQVHTWRKLSETEIACTICPTINIVANADDYAN